MEKLIIGVVCAFILLVRVFFVKQNNTVTIKELIDILSEYHSDLDVDFYPVHEGKMVIESIVQTDSTVEVFLEYV